MSFAYNPVVRAGRQEHLLTDSFRSEITLNAIFMPNSNSSSSISNSTDKILIDLGYLEYGKGGKKKLFFQLVSNFQIKLRMVVIGEKKPHIYFTTCQTPCSPHCSVPQHSLSIYSHFLNPKAVLCVVFSALHRLKFRGPYNVLRYMQQNFKWEPCIFLEKKLPVSSNWFAHKACNHWWLVKFWTI